MEKESSDLEESKQRKAVVRSASYPSITLDEAIEYASNISRNFPPPKQFDREDVSAILNKQSGVNRDVAACVQFGLFERIDGKYVVTGLLKKIQNPLNEAEKIKILRECFNTPKLYKELISAFDGKSIPPELRVHLIRFHAISEVAAADAAAIFLYSGKYCGVITEDNVLDFQELTAGGRIEYAHVINEVKDKNPIKPPVNPPPVVHQLPAAPENETLRIPLTSGNNAFLSYPRNMNTRDVEILTKQIELLGLVIS